MTRKIFRGVFLLVIIAAVVLTNVSAAFLSINENNDLYCENHANYDLIHNGKVPVDKTPPIYKF